MLSRSNALVVGLGGVTNGGKTTLCEVLNQRFSADRYRLRVKTLNLDEYYRPEDDSRHIYLAKYHHPDWDCFNAFDIDLFLQDLGTMRDQCDLLLVEGCLIFNIPSPFAFHLSYYFDLPYEACRERRVHRHYDPPNADGYFDEHVWPAFLQAKKNILSSNRHIGLKVIDSSKESFESLEERLVREIEAALNVVHPTALDFTSS